MPRINSLLRELDEGTIAREVGLPHDEARMRYTLYSNTVRDYEEFDRIIGDYYAYHFSACVARGGRLSRAEALGCAKELIEQSLRHRNGGTLQTAFHMAKTGVDGGLRAILDMISEELKAKSAERYLREVIERHANPDAWETRVEIVRELIARCGPYLDSSIRRDQPERYANNYSDLVRAYIAALQRTGSVFRRI